MQGGRLKSANKSLEPWLVRYPSDPRVLATKATIDAGLKIITPSEAEAIVRGLIVQNPDRFRLRGTAAYLRAQGGDRPSAIEELRLLVDEHPEDAYCHQVLAGQLHLDRENWSEAWQHYEIALQSGPLTSPCFKSAAYVVARKVHATNADLALRGSTTVQRAGVRSRAAGPRALLVLYLVLTTATLYWLSDGDRGLGFTFGAMALGWAGWAIYINDFACCKRCRNFWISLGVLVIVICL